MRRSVKSDLLWTWYSCSGKPEVLAYTRRLDDQVWALLFLYALFAVEDSRVLELRVCG